MDPVVVVELCEVKNGGGLLYFFFFSCLRVFTDYLHSCIVMFLCKLHHEEGCLELDY